jgi:hypothetical protein
MRDDWYGEALRMLQGLEVNVWTMPWEGDGIWQCILRLFYKNQVTSKI